MREAFAESGRAVSAHLPDSFLGRGASPPLRLLDIPWCSRSDGVQGAVGYTASMIPTAIERAYEGCRAWQKEGILLLEEWVDGEEVSVEGYCTDRDCSIIAITDKFLFPGVSPVEVGHCQPSMHAPLREQQIYSCCTGRAEGIGLDLVRFSCRGQSLHQRSAVDRDRRPAGRGPYLHPFNPSLDGSQFGESRDPAGVG